MTGRVSSRHPAVSILGVTLTPCAEGPCETGCLALLPDICTDISWADAQPGDLVFYPDNSHVGIVGGRDANGELLIIHCASGYNNVVVTGLEGFTSIARPNYYTN